MDFEDCYGFNFNRRIVPLTRPPVPRMMSTYNRMPNYLNSAVVHVPESQHSIFIRGFPGDMELGRIRDFFETIGGHCTFDFFKQSPDKTRLFVAVRFDTRDIARDIMDRYNNRDVLGYPMQMTWFKDIRRFAAYTGQVGQGHPSQVRTSPRTSYNTSRGGGYSGPRYSSSSTYSSNRNHRVGYNSTSNNRSTYYDPGVQRLKQRVKTHSIGGVTRTVYNGKERSDKDRDRQRSRSSSGSSKGGRSRSRSASGDRSSRSRSHRSKSKSSSPENKSRRKRNESESSAKSATAVGRKSSPNSSSPKKAAASSKAKTSPRPSVSPPPSTEKKATKTEVTVNTTPQKRTVTNTNTDAGEHPSPKRARGLSSSPPPSEKDKAKKEHLKNLRKQLAMESSDDEKNNKLKLNARDSQSPPTPTRAPIDSSDSENDSMRFKTKKTPALDKGNSSSDQLVINTSPRPFETGSTLPASYSSPKTNGSTKISRRARSSSSSSSDASMKDDGVTIRKLNGLSNGTRAEREVSLSNELITIQNSTVADIMKAEKLKQELEQPVKKPKKHKKKDKRELKLSTVTKEATADTDRQKKISAMAPEKLHLLQSKRKELEQAYKQDCETFATVVKMLISKDSSLEDKLLSSLRESLKDIGHKFITELNTFVDTLVAADD